MTDENGDDAIWRTTAPGDAEQPDFTFWAEADNESHTLDFFMEEVGQMMPAMGAGLDRGEALALAFAMIQWAKNDAIAACSAHVPVQNRDGKPPWCKTCGLTEYGLNPGEDVGATG